MELSGAIQRVAIVSLGQSKDNDEADARMATTKMLPSGPVAPPLRIGLPNRRPWTVICRHELQNLHRPLFDRECNQVI